VDRRRDRLDQRRGIGIVRERPHTDNAAILDLGQEGAPMGMILDKLGSHGGVLAWSRIIAPTAAFVIPAA
jgi:hypothetical protein